MTFLSRSHFHIPVEVLSTCVAMSWRSKLWFQEHYVGSIFRQVAWRRFSSRFREDFSIAYIVAFPWVLHFFFCLQKYMLEYNYIVEWLRAYMIYLVLQFFLHVFTLFKKYLIHCMLLPFKQLLLEFQVKSRGPQLLQVFCGPQLL